MTMSTEALIEQLMREVEAQPTASVVGVLHELLDDSTIDASDTPLGVAPAAALVGLSPHTLRYYEAQGLVRPERDSAGHRRYRPVHLRRLIFLTRMRLSGMPMSELGRYITLVDEGAATVDERRQMMLDQRDRIRHRMRELSLALEATEYKIRVYSAPEG